MCWYKINVGYGFLEGWFTKNDCRAMSSAFLSPMGECPIDPEEADYKLNVDQVHKEWKEYYKHQKKEMGREQPQISSKAPSKIEGGDFKGEGLTNI
jgi:hypothetical protein